MIIRYIEPPLLEDAVYKKLREVGITRQDYPINPYKLIFEEGIILNEIPFDNENIRGMIVHGKNATGITINQNRCHVSKRFIATHELMHHWFHPHKSKTICLEKYKDDIIKDMEWQANNATAFALMPTGLLFELYYDYRGDTREISRFLKVSEESLNYRLTELGLRYPEVMEMIRNIR